MQKNILWTGIASQSIENCIVTITGNGYEVNATIIGAGDNLIYKIDYQLKINQQWETMFFEIRTQLNGKTALLSFERDAERNWFKKGQPDDQYRNCIDIDISLTPLTNTLAINRLRLAEKEARQIDVLYVDVLEQQTKILQQKYTRLSASTYNSKMYPMILKR